MHPTKQAPLRLLYWYAAAWASLVDGVGTGQKARKVSCFLTRRDACVVRIIYTGFWVKVGVAHVFFCVAVSFVLSFHALTTAVYRCFGA